MIHISFGQDPIQGIYQSSYQFWSRVMQAYENGKDTSWAERTKRSDLEFKLLKKQQRSSMHESNNVKMDTKVVFQMMILEFNQAKLMIRKDPQFKTRWKLDHIWNFLKNFESSIAVHQKRRCQIHVVPSICLWKPKILPWHLQVAFILFEFKSC
ncbi:hypothetical protein F2Q69_00015971 [Brassica cretica]|uniref:No apical meristem-associated C-terminal domain-containing protein n=1 Tax=Brassica cretica TaxID=69181 RepID=A0A8S9QV02_BRACR|nr:hypothetical protein F2Q69_00015971 [Brassica cretica]